jgi:hypothetical protein
MDDTFGTPVPRPRLGLAMIAAVGGAATMIALTLFTTLPKDMIAAAGIVVMRLASAPYWLELAKVSERNARRAWFVVESLIYGLAIIGFYRVAEQLFGLAWR